MEKYSEQTRIKRKIKQTIKILCGPVNQTYQQMALLEQNNRMMMMMMTASILY